MSLNVIPIEVIEQIDPIVNFSKLDKRQYNAFIGPQTVSYQPYLSPNVSNSTIQLTTLPPSPQTAIDPKVWVKADYLLNFQGTSTSGNLIQLGIADAPRAFPFSQTVSTVSATLNGQSINTLLNQYFNALIHYGGYFDDMDKNFSTTPCQLDQCVEYKDLFGTNRSPFALFGENVFQDSRGGFSGVTIVSNTPTTAQIRLSVYEPIFLPCFYYNKSPLLNVRTLNWLFTFSNLNRIWSHDATNGNTITAQTTDITGFQLVYRFSTPKDITKIPKECMYAYSEIVPIISLGQATPAGAQIELTSQALNLQAVPNLIYIYVRKQDSDLSVNDADSFFRIDNISVNYDNVTGLLNTALPEDLYHISKENGYNGSWGQYNRGSSVVCLKVGKDIGLKSLQASGLLGAPQFSCKVKATNQSSQTITPQLFIQVVYEGVVTIKDGSMTKSTAVLSSSDVLQAELQNAKSVEYKPTHESFYGGSLMDSLMNVGKDIGQLVQSGTKLGVEVAPLLGLGLDGGRRKRRGRRGGAMSGGQMMDRDELMNIRDEYEE